MSASSSTAAATPSDKSSSALEITNVEVDAMLEVAPKYCTRIRHCESMKSVVPDTLPTVREDVPISSSARVFLLHNLLTPSECAHYIRETESLVYRDLSDEFDCDYRSNQRILVLSEKLADHLYSRMQLQLNRHDCLRVRPMCFGNSGTWKPVRLNECFKFGKYQQKQHFGTHIDGPWVPRTDESSIYTVLIYLNDDFTGGRTVFIPDDQRLQMDAKITEMRRTQCEEYDQIIGGGGGDGGATGSGGVSATMTNAATTTTSSSFTAGYTTNAADGIVTIQPRCGTALLFTHDTLHAGLPVMTGCKYVMRTELMFHRVDSEMIPSSIRESYQLDPAYQRTLKFYRESHEKNVKGDVTGFTNSYLEALKLQHQAQLSISADTRAIHALNLPIALYIHLFTYLNTRDLCRTLCVNHAWKDIAQDGVLWKMMYRIKFPHQLDAIVKMKILKQQQQHLEQKDRSYKSTSASNVHVANSSKIQLLKANSSSAVSGFSPFPGFSSSPPLTIDPSIEDWYTIYKQRVLLDSEFSPIIVDFGSEWTKVCLVKAEEEKEGEKRRKEEVRRIGATETTKEMKSDVSSTASSSSFSPSPFSSPVSSSSSSSSTSTLFIGSSIARVPGIHDMHMRQGCTQRIFLGRAGIEKYPEWIVHPFEHGKCIDVSVIPEFLAQAYLKLGTWSHKHPLVVAEPPFQWSQKFKVKFIRSMMKVFRVPAITFVNSALLTAISQGRPDSAIVVNVGAETAWISGLNESRQFVLVDFSQTSMRSCNRECNEDFLKRHPDMKRQAMGETAEEDAEEQMQGKVKEEEIERVTQTIITPSLLAEGVLDTYLRMHTLCSTSKRSLGTTINSVILTGGGTMEEEWRRSFTSELQSLERKYINNKDGATVSLPQVTFSSQYQSLAKVGEYPIITEPVGQVAAAEAISQLEGAAKMNALKNRFERFEKKHTAAATAAHPAARGKDVAAGSTAISPLLPFEIIFPFDSSSPSTSSLTTTLLGGTLFSGLPSFRSYCITSLEFRQLDEPAVHSTNPNDLSHHFQSLQLLFAASNMYRHAWTTGSNGWLNPQFLFSLIEAHFTYDQDEKEYIANTSCSDEELDDVEEAKEERRKRRSGRDEGAGDDEGDENGEDPDENSYSTLPRIIYRRRTRHSGPRNKRREAFHRYYDEKLKPTPALRAPSVHRRPRRSAFPVLPKMVKKWYEKQMKLREEDAVGNQQLLSSEDRDFLHQYRSRRDVGIAPPSVPYRTANNPDYLIYYDFMCSFWQYGMDPETNPEIAEGLDELQALYRVELQLQSIRYRWGEAHQMKAPNYSSRDDKSWEWLLKQLNPSSTMRNEKKAMMTGGEEKKSATTSKASSSSSFKPKAVAATAAAATTSSSSISSASPWSREPYSEEEDEIEEKYVDEK